MPARSNVGHHRNLIIQGDKNLSLFLCFPGEFLKSTAQQESRRRSVWVLLNCFKIPKTDQYVKLVTNSVFIPLVAAFDCAVTN